MTLCSSPLRDPKVSEERRENPGLPEPLDLLVPKVPPETTVQRETR